jgi:hypothetical protein
MERLPEARRLGLWLGVALLGASACQTNITPAPPGGGGGTPATQAPVATAAPGTPAPPAATEAPAEPSTPAPGPTQQVYRFDSNNNSPGVLGNVRLELGQRTFRASHTGTSNFILYVTGVKPGSFPDVAFNEFGAGTWTWTTQIQEAGDYTLDLKEADGQWTLTIE